MQFTNAKGHKHDFDELNDKIVQNPEFFFRTLFDPVNGLNPVKRDVTILPGSVN